MKRVLLASTIVLAAVLAFLIFKRFSPPAEPAAARPEPAAARPEPAAARPEPAAARPEPAAARPEPQEPQAKPQEAQAEPQGAQAKAQEARPPEPQPHAAAPPATPAQAKTAPAPALPAPPQAVAGPRPRTRRGAEPLLPDAAASAIFADRPAQAGEGGGHKVPRIPVLRRPAAGVASPSYAGWPSAPAHAPAVHPSGPAPAGRAAPSAVHPATVATATLPRAAAAAPGQRLPGAVSGLLRDAAGGSLNGVPVVAVAAGGDDAFETITDDEGFYLLAGMKAGRYLVFGGLGAPSSPALPARAVEVQDGKVARVDLRESGGGATVRARALGVDGRPLPGQVLLVAGLLPSQAGFPALLASDAIFRPEAGTRDLLRHVPAGVYTMVVLQGPEAAPRLAAQPVAVRGGGEQALEARFPAEAAAAPRR